MIAAQSFSVTVDRVGDTFVVTQDDAVMMITLDEDQALRMATALAEAPGVDGGRSMLIRSGPQSAARAAGYLQTLQALSI